MNWHRAIRFASLIAFAAGVGLLVSRLHRTDEQDDLTRYVNEDVPKLRASEQPIDERVDRLAQAPGLKPEAARTLLVDDVIPRLIRLRKQVEELPSKTPETRRLNAEYLRVTDRYIDACRACVRVIDDPKLSTADGVKQVRQRFDEVRQAYADWEAHVAEACVRNRLAKPTAR